MKERKEKAKKNESGSVDTLPVHENVGSPVELGEKRELKSKPSILKITLPEEVSQIVDDAIKTLRARGHEIRAEELLREELLTITKEKVDKLVLQYTPDEYYLEQARKLPEANALLVRQAKKMMLKAGTSSKTRKRRVQLDDGVLECAGESGAMARTAHEL
jgi:hypothetical protein